MKKKLNIVATILVAFLLVCSYCPSVNAKTTVPEPTSDFYVADFANVFSEETENTIVNTNKTLNANCGAQIVVVSVKSLGGVKISDYAYKIFNSWGIGSKEKNNGVLLLMAINEDDYYCMVGKGIDNYLTSAVLDDMLYTYLEPDFAGKNYDKGALKTFNALNSKLSQYYKDTDQQTGTGNQTVNNTVSQNNNSSENKNKEKKSLGGFWKFLLFILGGFILLCIWAIISNDKDMKRKFYEASGDNSKISKDNMQRYLQYKEFVAVEEKRMAVERKEKEAAEKIEKEQAYQQRLVQKEQEHQQRLIAEQQALQQQKQKQYENYLNTTKSLQPLSYEDYWIERAKQEFHEDYSEDRDRSIRYRQNTVHDRRRYTYIDNRDSDYSSHSSHGSHSSHSSSSSGGGGSSSGGSSRGDSGSSGGGGSTRGGGAGRR